MRGGDAPLRRRGPKPPTKKGAPRPDKPGATKKPARTASHEAATHKSEAAKAAPKKTPQSPAPARESAFAGERVAKAMARAGACSRRDAEKWIAEGRVAVNGRTLTSPAFNVSQNDAITVDGAPLQARERTRLFLFHKPAGFVTTAHDPEGRATVFDYLAHRHVELPRLISIGRLDINTEGLLLLTNDGGLARTLELPATGWTRRYRVRAHGEIDQAQLDALKAGVTVDDIVYAPIDARIERAQGANVWIAMSLTEGKNREIKRVMAHLGLDVTRLIRVSYGPFQLGDLAEGAAEEVKLKTLREQLGKSLAELAGADFAAPLRETTPAEQQEARERFDKRARKHVSVLRRQRDEKSEKGPRARIERSATADRKGRAVAVERVTPTRRSAEAAPASRNARRFEAMRRDAPGAGPAREFRTRNDSRPGDARTRPEAGRFDARSRGPRRAADARRDDFPPGAPRNDGEKLRGPRKGDASARDPRRARDDRRSAHGDARRERSPTRSGFTPRGRDEQVQRGARARPDATRPARGGAGQSDDRRNGPQKGSGRGSGKGPATGRAAPRGAAERGSRSASFKGPRKGPPKGPNTGPSRGPRKPRGA